MSSLEVAVAAAAAGATGTLGACGAGEEAGDPVRGAPPGATGRGGAVRIWLYLSGRGGGSGRLPSLRSITSSMSFVC